MKHPFDQLFFTAILVAFLLFGLGCLSLIGIGNLVETSHWVEHTQIVIDRLQTLLTDVEEESMAKRSFVRTGNFAYLQFYRNSRRDLFAQFQTFKDLTSDNQAPNHQKNLATLQDLLNQHNAAVERIGPSGQSVQLPILTRQIEDNDKLIDQIKAQIGAMQADERLLLQQRTAATVESSNRLRIIITAGSIFGILGILASTFFINREMAARRRTQRDLDRFFTLTNDLLCVAGFDGYFKKVNPAWEKTFGYTNNELTSRPFEQFLHPDDVEKTRHEFARQLSGHDVISFENRYRCKDGSYRWLLWNAHPLVAEQTIYASARDLTERKNIEHEVLKLNEDLKQRADQLETANKELESFSYSVSHDLRAPLRHIHGFVELLQKAPAIQTDESSRRQMSIIAKAAREMGVLIDDLLAFSRTGRAEMHPIKVDMREIIDQIIQDRAIECKGRRVTWEIKPLSSVAGDPNLLRLVWTNLLDNALKYTRPRDQAKIEIGQIVDQANGAPAREIVFYVRDNGVGFDMRYAAKLFGVFQRLHRAELFEGTGIGLANVQRIIHRHGGRVWAESQVDSGATFYFSLPVIATQPT
ncbi:MAG TPA: ATP-binding protein [Candidatus Methylacidiphilales bacterium]|jgi:PAS domain S-box-containing protein|nr:ATP-binding protein [Candidatus Methylacidiphilales bacterium]